MKKTIYLPIIKTIELMTMDEFSYYLAGLIEADGCFKRDALTIKFQLEDFALAKSICCKLNLDSKVHLQDVRLEKHPSQCYRFIVYKGKIAHILQVINGKFVTPYKVQQLKTFNYARYLPKTQTILSPNTKNFKGFWLSGFFDGDGSTSIYIEDTPKKRLFKCIMSISQSGSPCYILDLYGKQFNLNVISLTRKKVNPNARSEFCVRTEGIQKLQTLLDFFEVYPLQAVKRIQLHFLKQALGLYKKKAHLTVEEQFKFQKWRRLIRRVTLESQERQTYALKPLSCL